MKQGQLKVQNDNPCVRQVPRPHRPSQRQDRNPQQYRQIIPYDSAGPA